MTASPRRRLALAACTFLIAPLALAQTTSANVDVSAQSNVAKPAQLTAQLTGQPTPRLPPPVLLSQSSNSSEALLNSNAPLPAQQLNESEPPPASELEEEAMSPPGAARVKSRGARDATTAPASLPSRSWTPLDVDGDGRISAAEARADTGFSAGFGATDSNGDGFVSQAEFRARARGRDDDGSDDRKN